MISAKTLSRSGNRRLFLLFLATFVVYGSTVTMFGAALPRIIADFAWSYTVTGLVLASVAVGCFVSSFAIGLLLERRRSKPIFLAALMACAVGIALFARSSSPALNLLLCLVVGVSQGVFEVVINFGAVRLEKAGQSRVMSLLHAGFSVGAVLGPVGISFFLSNGSSWQLVFPVLAVLYLVLAALFAVTPFFGPEPVAADRERRGIALLRQPLFLLLSLAALFYVGSELGASNWISEYFVKVLGTSPGAGAYAVSILWAGILAGRTLVSALFHEKREEWVVFVLCLMSVAALLGLTASRSPVTGMLVVFALGLGYSGIYPLLMSITGKAFRTTASVGMFTTVAGIGSFSFPFLLAGISQGAGLRAGFLLLAILPLGTLVISVVVARYRHGGRRRDTTTG